MWTGTEIKINFIAIRHGATASNERHSYLGKTEEPLSKKGIRELLKQRDSGKYPPLDALFTSPMQRCLQTAELLYGDMRSNVIPEWREMDFGEFEGKNYEDLNGNRDYQHWIDSSGTLPFPDGESQKEFIARIRGGLDRMFVLLPEFLKEKKEITVGAIVHGGTIMALFHSLSGDNYFSYQTANGNGYRCMLRRKDKQIKIEEIEEFV